MAFHNRNPHTPRPRTRSCMRASQGHSHAGRPLATVAIVWYAFARQSEASAPGQAGEGLYIEPPNGRESANGRQFHHAARADVRVAELDDRGKDPPTHSSAPLREEASPSPPTTTTGRISTSPMRPIGAWTGTSRELSRTRATA